MLFKDIPIRQKLTRVILLTSLAVLLLTCTAFCTYELLTFRQGMIRQVSTLGEIIATNSTAALAFDSPEDAEEILTALKADRNIIAAGLYNSEGALFSNYTTALKHADLPLKPEEQGYRFTNLYLESFQPVVQGSKRLGTLYLRYDLSAMYDRFKLYGIIVMLVIAVSSLFAYLLSKILQKGISKPILSLAGTAKTISSHKDYSVRATKNGNDEIGMLTDAFNQMLIQIEEQNEALSEFNQKLEQKVIDRTRELEVVNKELESFSYTVSHDLRAPLRSIHGYTNILLEEYKAKLDEEGQKHIATILNNTKKMGQLIDDLLAFSKLGRKELNKVKFSMRNVAMEVWEDLYKMEDNRNIEFILSDIPEAYADVVTIRQVWINLISNALKYTRKRENAIIEISSEDKDGRVVYFIRDNGAGFDMKYVNKLFGVFQRLHKMHEFEGTGVGLAIVERIITKHNGKIWADAKLNEGAKFSFSLDGKPRD